MGRPGSAGCRTQFAAGRMLRPGWPVLIVERHPFQRRPFQHRRVATFLVGNRQQGARQLQTRRLNLRRITAEVASDLLPSRIKCLPNGLEGSGSKRTAIDQLPGLHNGFAPSLRPSLKYRGLTSSVNCRKSSVYRDVVQPPIGSRVVARRGCRFLPAPRGTWAEMSARSMMRCCILHWLGAQPAQYDSFVTKPARKAASRAPHGSSCSSAREMQNSVFPRMYLGGTAL